MIWLRLRGAPHLCSLPSVSVFIGSAVRAGSRALLPHRPREEGRANPQGTSRTNLAAALALFRGCGFQSEEWTAGV